MVLSEVIEGTGLTILRDLYFRKLEHCMMKSQVLEKHGVKVSLTFLLVCFIKLDYTV